MSDDKKPPEGYKVGKGRPPFETRFQRGKSGNPNGRPKGKKVPSFLEALAARAEETVIITEKGRRKSVPGTVALAAQMFQRAFTSVKDAAQLAKLLQQLPPDTESSAREQHEDADRALQKVKDMVERRKQLESLGFAKPDEPKD